MLFASLDEFLLFNSGLEETRPDYKRALTTLATMKPLNIPPGPGIPKGLVIPAAELTERFARSGGPGGQGVNTTDSKVQLSVDIAKLTVLSDVHRRRALQNLSHRLDGTTLTVSVTTQRSQVRNRAEARRRLADLIREAVQPPPPKRRRTRPSRASIARRKAQKQRRSELKASRRRPSSY